ncbi:MAG: hypothetical protein L6R41_003060 [Letrouitia leprolyta]|nr:MAG: hypothetical protein L6R41_003060 [Letrouitia leprolyta]
MFHRSNDPKGAWGHTRETPSLSIGNEDSQVPSMSHQPAPGWRRRLGWTAASILLVGTIVNLAGIAFLAFLWFTDYKNASWHNIILHDWLIKSVTIISEVLKASINLQAGICAGMLAAVALEKGEVRFGNLPSITTARSGLGGGKIFSLTWTQLSTLRFGKLWSLSIATLVLLQSIVFVISQIITIILTSDIALQSVRGSSYPSNIAFGFEYKTPNNTNIPSTSFINRQSTWSRKSDVYPAFAEYSEPPFEQEGVQDTGLTLRAFLPYSAVQIRQNTYSYSGRTTVLDSRVTCQRPTLVNATVQTEEGIIYFRGRVRASMDTPRLGNVTLQYIPGQNFQYVWNQSIPFSCAARVLNGNMDSQKNAANQWRSSLCQLPEGGGDVSMISGGLISEFKPNLTLPGFDESDRRFQYSSTYGTAYLLLNVTAGDSEEWAAVTEAGPTRPPYFSKTNEWMDLIYSKGHLILSSTLCYAAYDSADIPVNITSTANRTEPEPVFDSKLQRYTFSDYRKQLGQGIRKTALNERQILALDKQSWVASPSEIVPQNGSNVDPYLRSAADMSSPSTASSTGNFGNTTAVLWDAASSSSTTSNETDTSEKVIDPEPMHKWLFQDIMQNGGTSAFAVQSLITLFSGMTYYDQVGQFNKEGFVSRADFVIANVPGRHRGFIAVLVFVIVQLVLAAVVLIIYLASTKWSQLGNAWLNFSQAVTEQTERYLGPAAVSTEEEMEKVMKDEGVLKKRVQLQRIHKEGGRVAAVMVNEEGGPSDQPLLGGNGIGSNIGMTEAHGARRRPGNWERGHI